MLQRYRLFKRGRMFYSHDSETGKQESQRTQDRQEAKKLLHAKNETHNNRLLNLSLGRTYLAAHNPGLVNRIWSEVMEQMIENGCQESTRRRCRIAFKNAAFDRIRDQHLCDTASDDFLAVLRGGSPSVNHYLRRLHNLAMKYGWLAWPILPPKGWPKIQSATKRAITHEEHQKILACEQSPEWRSFYELLWELGASQSDAARLTAENIDWESGVIHYQRQKLDPQCAPAVLVIGPRVESILRSLPEIGPLFPTLCQFKENVRSWHFAKRCKKAKVTGVTLHSYRYGWAERAARAGYPERWAQAALGHNSRAVHQAYAKRARVVCPPLEEYENRIGPVRNQCDRTMPEPRSPV